MKEIVGIVEMDTSEIGSIEKELVIFENGSNLNYDYEETFESCANVIGKVQATTVNTGKVLETSEDNGKVQETSENVPIGSKNCFLR